MRAQEWENPIMETPPTKSPRETLDSLGALVDTIQYLSQYGSFVGASDLYEVDDSYGGRTV